MAVTVVNGEAELYPDEACDKVVSEITDRVCGKCDLKHLCPLFDKADPEGESCEALKILERLFLHGKISFKQATVAEEMPPRDAKRTYNLEGL